jgi:hypothetical protein
MVILQILIIGYLLTAAGVAVWAIIRGGVVPALYASLLRLLKTKVW